MFFFFICSTCSNFLIAALVDDMKCETSENVSIQNAIIFRSLTFQGNNNSYDEKVRANATNEKEKRFSFTTPRRNSTKLFLSNLHF
jgi:hypothetical protein